jgi:hypothetical protein
MMYKDHIGRKKNSDTALSYQGAGLTAGEQLVHETSIPEEWKPGFWTKANNSRKKQRQI